ncbi:heme-degrading domain-containing protein [Paenibacillus athensensis]|uniref:Uncharacterized protein n=1 Tax=Paenibacillus athensensis TaxID=1967502 RepID=A0A4Y8QAY2_9BACL|nr:heme-degrading domain-containing protein [Paenibacillus athensensis]MCD1260149.1 heme-degrading domain-containing protein [Paenibacillus athensensis]
MNEFMKTLLGHEEELQFDAFSNEDALRLGTLIRQIALDEVGKGVAIHIENDRHPLFTHYMEGSSEGNTYWIQAKKNVVKHFGHSSLYVGESFKAQGTTFKLSSGLPESDYQGEGGSFPLLVRGEGRIGTITVSGLPGEEDHQLVVTGIRRFLQK